MAKSKDIKARDLIIQKLDKGEETYSSIPRKWKRDYNIIVRSNFEEVYNNAPEGLWKTRDFIKAVLVILKIETNTNGFNLNHFKDFVKKFKYYNHVDSNLGGIVTSSFYDYGEYTGTLLNLLNSD